MPTKHSTDDALDRLAVKHRNDLIGIALLGTSRPAVLDLASIAPAQDAAAGAALSALVEAMQRLGHAGAAPTFACAHSAVLRTQDGKLVDAVLFPLPLPDGARATQPAPGVADPLLARLATDVGGDEFQRFIGHLPAGVVVHHRDGSIAYANALAASLLGLSIDSLLGASAFDDTWRFVNSDGSPMLMEHYPALRSLSLRQDLHDLVVGMQDATGHVRSWLLCNTLLVNGADGEPAMVSVSFTDCTELKTTQNALRLSEERLRLILLGTNDAPWDWDLVTNELYYSDRWWTMIGRQPGELPADPGLWSRLAHPADLAAVSAILASALENGTTYEVEFRLQHKDGHYVPVLSRGFVLRDDGGRAVRVSGTNSDLTERKKNEHRIHHLAYFDQLTGLPNRRHLLEHFHAALARSTRTGQLGAILLLDIDNFKDLNDTFGHDVGDAMLCQFGERLRHVLREHDHLARLGGDEFVVLVEDLGTSALAAGREIEAVGEKLLAAIEKKFFLPPQKYMATSSIGIAMFGPSSNNIDVLLKQADLAMYSAKEAGRGLLRFFDPAMQQAVDERTALEARLRDAIGTDQFALYCQPQFDAHRRLIGGELLLRWRHPQRGLVGPAAFIPLAETCGLIMPIGAWVLAEACRAVASWRDDPVLGRLTFSVNISAQQLHHKHFVQQTLATLQAAQLAPERICLELTESLLAQNVEDVIGKMQALRSHGIHFSIDDFGTGYSSLSYLRRLPLHALKIDQSFIQDDKGDAIVEVIISLGKKLDLEVIAEGVENQAQVDSLTSKGCHCFQGFLFGKPMPLAAFYDAYGSR